MAHDRDDPDVNRQPLASLDELVSLCARRGFVFASSEIYGGINGFWDYGPLGVELKNNLKTLWWRRVVRERDDVEGLDSSIVAHPRIWEASGHVDNFSDPMIDCRACKRRVRADQIDEAGPCAGREGTSEHDWTEPRAFDLMLRTHVGAAAEGAVEAPLRPETCQSIFADFKRVRETARQTIPFGIAQIGKAFRNEINPRHFTFRSREFEQAELEFFVREQDRDEWFEYWLAERLRFHHDLGFEPDRLRVREQTTDELAHYAKKASDIEYHFPFGWQEIEGIHDRGDWDLSRHGEFSGKDLSVTDEDTKARYTPVIIETSVGIDRTCLALLAHAYAEEQLDGGERRTVLRLNPALAPVKAAVLPLSKKLSEPAQRIAQELRSEWNVFFDAAGNIGRRYRRQDEIGTPYCVTYDFDSENDHKVTVRDRDTTEQQRIAIDQLAGYLSERILGY